MNNMSLASFYQISKFFVIPVVLSVITLGFACSGMMNHVSMHDMGMNSVAVMSVNNQECCNTSISKNIGSWKSVLLVIPREIKDALFLLLLGFVAAFSFVGLQFRHDPNDRGWLSYRFYIRDNPDLVLFNHLKLAFARGILNPKVY